MSSRRQSHSGMRAINLLTLPASQHDHGAPPRVSVEAARGWQFTDNSQVDWNLVPAGPCGLRGCQAPGFCARTGRPRRQADMPYSSLRISRLEGTKGSQSSSAARRTNWDNREGDDRRHDPQWWAGMKEELRQRGHAAKSRTGSGHVATLPTNISIAPRCRY